MQAALERFALYVHPNDAVSMQVWDWIMDNNVPVKVVNRDWSRPSHRAGSPTPPPSQTSTGTLYEDGDASRAGRRVLWPNDVFKFPCLVDEVTGKQQAGNSAVRAVEWLAEMALVMYDTIAASRKDTGRDEARRQGGNDRRADGGNDRHAERGGSGRTNPDRRGDDRNDGHWNFDGGRSSRESDGRGDGDWRGDGGRSSRKSDGRGDGDWRRDGDRRGDGDWRRDGDKQGDGNRQGGDGGRQQGAAPAPPLSANDDYEKGQLNAAAANAKAAGNRFAGMSTDGGSRLMDLSSGGAGEGGGGGADWGGGGGGGGGNEGGKITDADIERLMRERTASLPSRPQMAE